MADIADDAGVLVAVVTRPADLERAREAGWYRVPVARAPQQLAAAFLAFYQTAAFGAERWAVRYYAPIERYAIVRRADLLPDEPAHPRAQERYYRLDLGPLSALAVPVPARRLRRVTFISTSFGQLRRAADVADLWHPLEDDAPADEVWAAGIAGRSVTF